MTPTPVAVLAELKHHGLDPPPGASWIGSRRDGHERVYAFLAPDGTLTELRTPIRRVGPSPEERRRTFRLV